MPADDLADLLADISRCRLCRDAPGGSALPHEPRPVLVASRRAPVLIAGQAPGTRVHASGVPFDDRSGDRLREWMGVDRAAFYDPERFAIAPMGFCFPGLDAKGGDLPPRRECAPQWRDRLMAGMGEVRLVLAVGLHAQRWHLGAAASRSLGETMRRWRSIMETSRPRTIVLPHPSWRNTHWMKQHPFFEAEVLPALKREIRAALGT